MLIIFSFTEFKTNFLLLISTNETSSQDILVGDLT